MHDRDIFLSFKYVLFFDKFNDTSHEVFFCIFKQYRNRTGMHFAWIII